MSLARDRLRLHVKALGFPVDDLSDDAVDAGVAKAMHLLGAAEATTEEAYAALVKLAAHGINVRLLMERSGMIR
jgi:hypothetical protein